MAFKGLFIGIDRYASPGIEWLSCSGRDAMALHALFTDTLGGDTTFLIAVSPAEWARRHSRPKHGLAIFNLSMRN